MILTNTTPGLSFIGVGEKFGYSVDAESGVLAVGAPLEGTGGDDEGMVVLIDDGGDNWASVQATDVKKLYGGVHGVPDIGNIILYNQFGSGVALEQQHDGLLLVAGSQRYIYGNYRGAIHTIKDINGDGDYGDTGEFATLKNGTHNLSIDTDDYFGASVAIDDGTIVVGADDEKEGAGNRGKAFVVDYGFYASIASDEFEKDATPTDDDDLGVGTVTVSAAPTDRAGNTGSSISGTFIYDITAPDTPTIDLAAADDTGASSTDNNTKNATALTISGCAEASSEVMLYNNGNSFGGRDGTYDLADTTDTGCTGGTKQYTADISLTADETHPITAKATDVAGNTSTASTILSITVDTTAPTITTGTPDLAAADDAGSSDTDNITNATTDLSFSGTLSGAAATNDYVQLYNGGTALSGATDSTFTGNNSRDWSIDTDLAESTHSITAKVIDLAGNAGTLSSALSVTVDTTAPSATTSGAPSGTDNTTTLAVTVAGTDVTHYKHKVAAGTACTATGYGSETAIATTITNDISSLADGSVTLCVLGRDAAGNYQSTPTKTTWTKDTALPTISSGFYSGTTVVLTMSEPVYSALTAGDFKVDDDGTDLTASAVAVASSANAASATVTLTMPSTIAAGSTAKVFYTKGSTVVKDIADNELAALTEANGITLTDATVTITHSPSDGGYFTAAADNITIDFSQAVFSENTCTTALTDATAGTITDLKENDSSGDTITHTAAYDATTPHHHPQPGQQPHRRRCCLRVADQRLVLLLKQQLYARARLQCHRNTGHHRADGNPRRCADRHRQHDHPGGYRRWHGPNAL